MAEARHETASIVDRTQAVAVSTAVVGVHFMGTTAALVLGDEAVVLVRPKGEPVRVEVHSGAILCSAAATDRLLTGGDDGKVVEIDSDGATRVVATDANRRWIDHLAFGPSGAFAWSAGKNAFVRGKDEPRVIELPSTVGGLAFLPKGFRLAIAHYNGATLWFPNAPKAPPERLEWKGSHLGITISLDGRFLVTTMQEPMLHGWRLADRGHMRMSGYATRVTSMDWTVGGRWLATSGATQLILWPFQSKDGPTGKQPRILAPHEHRVERVACHPLQDIVAVGYADGMVLLIRIDDGAEILAKRPGAAPITALGFSADGRFLAFGAEDGAAGLLDLA